MLFSLIRSALMSVVLYMLVSTVIKFVLYWALFYFTMEGLEYIASQVQINGQTIQQLLSEMTPGFWYFANLFMLPAGLSMIISAFVLRFAIRRVPLLG